MFGDVEISFVGNIAGEVETKYTPSGVALAKFTVAVNRRVKGPDGQWKDGEPSFFRCSAWRQLAEHVSESLGSGDRVIVQGTIAERRWEQDGQPRSSWEVNAQAVGPELSWATAKVQRLARGARAVPSDAWQTNPEPPF